MNKKDKNELKEKKNYARKDIKLKEKDKYKTSMLNPSVFT